MSWRRGAAAFLCATALFAQDQKFRVQSRLVQVRVVVTDAQGRPADGLEAADFELLDAGRPRPAIVDDFSSGLAPISMIIAVQSSGISAAALGKIRKIGPLFQPLITGERGCAGVMAFDQNIRWLQECTADAGLVGIAFERLRPSGFKTARMLDAAAEAVTRLKERSDSRRILLLIAEPRDRGSETDLESVARMAESAGVSIYATTFSAFLTPFTTRAAPQTKLPQGQRRSTIGHEEPGSPPRRDREPQIPPPEQQMDLLGAFEELGRLGTVNTTEVLARRTGGAVLAFTRLKGLEEAIQKVGAELHTQYVLSFAPAEESAAGYHPLEVRVKKPGEWRVRARPGYWAGSN